MKNKSNSQGIIRVIKAFGFSFAGLRAAFVNEAAFRQEVVVALVMAPVAVWFGQNGVERALLVGSMLLVLLAELVNSAIEAVVDRVGEEQHHLSGRAKDIGSAAVLISIAHAVVIWFFILCGR